MWEWIRRQLGVAYSILVAAGRGYGTARINRMAAAVAYRAIFAVAPLILIAVSVFGLVIGDSQTAQQEINDAIRDLAGDEVADAVVDLVGSAIEGASTAAVVGFVLVLWTSSSLFLELQHDLNDIFEVPDDDRSGVLAFIRQRGLGLIWTFGVGMLLVVVWGINLIWGLFESLFDRSGLGLLHDIVSRLTPWVALVVMPVLFALIFQSLTRMRVRRRALYYGSVFTSVAFLLAAYGIGLYFSWNSETSATRFAGAFFVVLLAAFVLSSVFLYGALVMRIYQRFLETGTVAEPTVESGYEVVVAQPEPAMPVAAVLGFLGGLLVGWRRRR